MTTSTLSPQAYATANTVRVWALANGFPAGGSRGKLPADTIKAYNRSNGLKFKYRAYTPTKAVETRSPSGKKVVRKVSVSAARAILVASGDTVGKRGRLTNAQLQRALALA